MVPKNLPLWKPLVAVCVLMVAFVCLGRLVRSGNATAVQNGGFEEAGNPLPAHWSRDFERTAGKGDTVRDTTRSYTGTACLRLEPNDTNGGDHPLAVSQVIPARTWRGRKVNVSAWGASVGDAHPIFAVLHIVRGVPGGLLMLPSSESYWTRMEGEYEVPDDPTVQLVVVAMVSGRSGTAWFDDVSIVPVAAGAVSPPRPLQDEDAEILDAYVVVNALNTVRRIPSTLFGTNIEWRWNGNFIWQSHERRLDPEIVRLTRDLGVTLIRYPGGVYSDYYHWQQGVGPYEDRPIVYHEPGKDDRSRINFGTDEALALADEIGGELMITVNAGTGTVEEAAEWVRYVNRDELRVRYWEVGNEVYVNDGTVFATEVTMGPYEYVTRFLEFQKAMRDADPRIMVGAVGGENQGAYRLVGYNNWNRILLSLAGNAIDFLSVHNAYAPVLLQDEEEQDLRKVYRAMLARPALMRWNLETLEGQIEEWAPGRDIPIAITEWGPFFSVSFQSPFVDHNKTLGSALYAASAFKVILESPGVDIAAFWHLSDVSVLGWIGSLNSRFPADPEWAPTARYHALQLYSKHFGRHVIESSVQVPTFESEAVGFMDAVSDVPYLDVVSSLSADGNQMFIMAINKDFDRPIEATFELRGFRPRPSGTAWTLSGRSIDANTGTRIIDVPGLDVAEQAEDSVNPRFRMGGRGEIGVSSSPISVSVPLRHIFPARSVTSLVLTRE